VIVTAEIMKNVVFWVLRLAMWRNPNVSEEDITSISRIEEKTEQETNRRRLASLPLLFETDKRSYISIGKFVLSPTYTAIEMQKPYSSFPYDFFIYA
jgi:hypothetical protein